MKPTKTPYYFLMIIFILITGNLSLAQSPDDVPTIRFSAGENTGLEDVIAQRVFTRLEDKGYETELTLFATVELNLEAMVTGQIDVLQATSHSTWLAMANGVPIVTVLEVNPPRWMIAGSTDIQSCDDWNGVTFAQQSETSLTAAMASYYVDEFCPGVTYEVAYIRGSANRAAALLGGAADITIVSIETISPLIEEASDDLHIVADLMQDMSWLIGSALHITDDFIENYPDATQDIITTYIEVYRDIIEDPEGLVEEAVEQLGLEPEEAEAILDIYLENDLFIDDGGLTEERVTQSLEFLGNTGFVDAELTLEDVVELTFIETALAELDSE
jgi:NitT/TauT family transport system substrate-binding protein